MRGRNSRAFTLVELIVVIAVLAILAAAGVGTAVGYMKRSKFTKNQQNAVTVFQTTQTALAQLEKNGSIETWVNDKLLKYGSDSPYSALNPSSNTELEQQFSYRDDFNIFPAAAGASIHTRVSLTYIPNNIDDQGTVLADLIRPYFTDTTVFQSTISVEFDVVKVYDSDLQPHYSANCFSAFVSAEYKDGWDGGILPKRDEEYRANTSKIGYFDASDGSLTDVVYIPVIENLNVSYFSVRFNPWEKKLNIGWSVSSGTSCVLGRGKHIQYSIILQDPPKQEGDEPSNIVELVLVEDILLEGQNLEGQNDTVNLLEQFASANTMGSTIQVGSTTYDVQTADVDRTVTVGSEVKNITYNEKYIEANATVFVSKETGNIGNFNSYPDEYYSKLVLPVRISYITGDIDSKGNALAPYITYTVTIDRTALSSYPGKLFDPSKHTTLVSTMTVCPNEFGDTSPSYQDYNANGGVIVPDDRTFGYHNDTDDKNVPVDVTGLEA